MALRGATGAPVAVAEEDRKYVPTGVETTVVTKEQEPGGKSEEPSPQSKAGSGASLGIVLLYSVPDSAEVWVDGSFIGNTPAKLSLSPGKHKIKVSIEGREDWEREIEVLRVPR